jgi:hypothetical protein
VATGETVAALAESGTQTGLVELVTRAGSRLRQAMGVGEPPTAEAGGLAAVAPSSLEAQRLYAEGLARLRELDALAARDQLQKAVEADPDSSLVRVASPTPGRDPAMTRAQQEAQGVRSLRGPLPRVTASRWKAASARPRGEWARATEIYAALLAFFLTTAGYGLRPRRALEAA